MRGALLLTGRVSLLFYQVQRDEERVQGIPQERMEQVDHCGRRMWARGHVRHHLCAGVQARTDIRHRLGAGAARASEVTGRHTIELHGPGYQGGDIQGYAGQGGRCGH